MPGRDDCIRARLTGSGAVVSAHTRRSSCPQAVGVDGRARTACEGIGRGPDALDEITKDTADVLQLELPELRRGESLAAYCAYAVGGPAELLYEATTTSSASLSP